jgi:hypothetical protein
VGTTPYSFYRGDILLEKGIRLLGMTKIKSFRCSSRAIRAQICYLYSGFYRFGQLKILKRPSSDQALIANLCSDCPVRSYFLYVFQKVPLFGEPTLQRCWNVGGAEDEEMSGFDADDELNNRLAVRKLELAFLLSKYCV